MPKRSSKDINVAAFNKLQAVTGAQTDVPVDPTKNPAAVALGRLGGLKGGKARAESLSKRRRKEIASAAATARWAKNLPEES